MRTSYMTTAVASFSFPEAGRGADEPRSSMAQPGSVRWDEGPYWSAWSRAAVRLMQARTATLVRELELQGRSYRWTLDTPWLLLQSRSGRAVADICVIGRVSGAEGSFRWAWADEGIPSHAQSGLERVREFGEINGLDLLTTPAFPASRAQAHELSAVAARVLNAAALWIENAGDHTLFFALSNVRPA